MMLTKMLLLPAIAECTEWLVHARHCSKSSACITLFNPSNNPKRQLLSSFPPTDEKTEKQGHKDTNLRSGRIEARHLIP